MSDEARAIGYRLLETGTLVSFRIIEQEVLRAPDEAEFGLRVQLKFVPDGSETDLDEDEAAGDTAEWGALGFMFTLGVLSFSDAKPREASVVDYVEADEFRLADFIDRLRFAHGELRFDADYVRGRRIKTQITVRSNGTVLLETSGRGKSALRWLERLQGRKLMQLVGR